MQEEVICKNCETHFRGHFCPQCGQSSHVKRIDATYFLHDIPHSIFHIDKGLPYTFYQLCVRPGATLLAYLQGKRVSYFKPFAYVIILSTLSSLFLKLVSKKAPIDTGTNAFTLFSQYPSALIFVLVPLVSAISWMVFRKKQFNYWEHFLMHTYLAAHINIILVLMHLIGLSGLLDHVNLSIKLTIFNTFFMTYHGFTFSSLFTNNYQQKFDGRLMAGISICCFLLGSVYALALIFSRIAIIWF